MDSASTLPKMGDIRFSPAVQAWVGESHVDKSSEYGKKKIQGTMSWNHTLIQRIKCMYLIQSK